MNLLDRYEKIANPWVKLALTPIMGGLFLMFMPAIGFILVGHALYKNIIDAIKYPQQESNLQPPA